MSYKYKTIVFIGRFQPFHNSHLEIVSKALELAETVIISVGSAKKPPTIKNPWTAQERIEMIQASILEKYHPNMNREWTDKPQATILDRIKFTQVRDHMYNNVHWGNEVYLKALEAGATSGKDTALIGSFKDGGSWFLNFFPQWDLVTIPIGRFNNKTLNATDIRHELFEEKYLEDLSGAVPNQIFEAISAWINSPAGSELREQHAFLKQYKIDHSYANPDIKYRPPAITVDAIVIKSGHILLIKRKFHPGKGLFALPGGFINDNESIVDSALRELREETSIAIPKAALELQIKHTQIFDHPKRSERARTVTHAYLIDLGEGPLPEVKAGDDASGAHWVHLKDALTMEGSLYEDHYDIINSMVSRY